MARTTPLLWLASTAICLLTASGCRIPDSVRPAVHSVGSAAGLESEKQTELVQLAGYSPSGSDMSLVSESPRFNVEDQPLPSIEDSAEKQRSGFDVAEGRTDHVSTVSTGEQREPVKSAPVEAESIESKPDTTRPSTTDPSETEPTAFETAQENQALRFESATEESYVAQALVANPKIVALQHRVASVRHRIVQARSLPDPSLQETFWPFNGNALETAGGRAVSQIGVSQQVPWPEKLKTKAAIACREVQIAEAELALARLEVAESVRLACNDIAFADKTLKVLDSSRDLVEQLIEVSSARFQTASKVSGQQDVLRAQLEGDRLEDRTVAVRRQKNLAKADLATLIHQPRLKELDVQTTVRPTASTTDLDELIALAESCNPALVGLTAEIARNREKQRLACLQQYPDFQLGANWLIVSDRDALSPVATGNDNFGFTVGVTLPVWRDKIRSGIAEAGHQTLSTANLLESERDSLAGKLRRLVVEFDAVSEQVKILQERIIPRTEHALEIAMTDYAGSRTDFLSVIDLYEERLSLELQQLSFERKLQETLIRIETLVGCSAFGNA